MSDETEITGGTMPYHIPALLPQCLEALQVRADGVYIDCTLGGGGHSRAIASALTAGGRLLAFDQDTDALERAVVDPALGGREDGAVQLVHSNFRYLRNFARFYGVDGRVDGVLADLGVSFHHFDDPGRGFSFRFPEGPLDMRMNREGRLTAADVVNTYTPERLAEILRLYGELSQARRMAAAIARARPLATAQQLVEAVTPALNPRQTKKELAQVFQALRIEVNDEIAALRELLGAAVRVLRPGGRLCVITYHSLEDRLVKNFMRTGNTDGREEKDFFGRSSSPLKILTPRPVVPDEAEIEANPRSRSAKMRCAEKTDNADS